MSELSATRAIEAGKTNPAWINEALVECIGSPAESVGGIHRFTMCASDDGDRVEEVVVKNVGRNGSCSCGSGLKAKRCCGVRRGPSVEELARSFLVGRRGWAALALVGLDRDEFDELFHEVLHLPEADVSVQVDLPRLLPPEVERLRAAIDADDGDELDEALPAALVRLDTWERRAGLARAVLALRVAGRVDGLVAAMALVDLNCHPSALLASSVVEALAVSVGAHRTPAGLMIGA